MKRFLKVIGWLLLWLISFWSFLIITFPAEAAKGWFADRLGKRLNTKVSIEELSMRWSFGIRLKGVSIEQQSSPLSLGEGQGEGGFTINLNSINIKPAILSLIRLKPEIVFTGSPSSGGSFTGSYVTEGLSLSFKDVLFKDFAIATLPIPSTAMFSGSGRFRLVKGRGTIEVEVNGAPGGKQKTAASGGEGPGLDGKLKVTVSMPGLNLPQ